MNDLNMSSQAYTDQTNAEIGAIQALIQAGRIPEGLAQLEALPKELHGDTTVLYLRGVCFRLLGDYGAAERALFQLLDQRPSYGRAFQELGHVYRDGERGAEALGAYATACFMNPALKASWSAQKALLDPSLQPERFAQVSERLRWVESLPNILLACLDATHEGKLVKAEDYCRRFLQKHPQHVEGIRMLANIAVKQGVLEDAEFLLESAVTFEPGNKQAEIDYIQVLSKRQRFQQAVDRAVNLLEQDPDNPQFKSLCAIQCMQIAHVGRALRLFDQVIEQVPQDPVTHVSKGHALKTAGHTGDAIASYRRAIECQALHCEAWYSLANLKTYTFSEHELKTLQALDKNPQLTGQDRVYLQFALGKAFEDRKAYETSFVHYAKGNAIKRAQVQYHASGTTKEIDDQIAACPPSLFAKTLGCDAPDPIFIVGLPRSGSTLLEQILSSHSQIDGTLELPNVLSISGKLRRLGRRSGNRRYPFNLADLSRDQLHDLGEAYIRDTRVHRQEAPFFIDKMPNNFRHIGLIKLMLPKAKVIDARRAPMACCFSGFKQLFAEGQFFSYDLEDIGQYYKDYVRLMTHWDSVMPGFVLRVQHEELVNNLEQQVKRMLEFCGLPFEPACLEFHKTERHVRTPSSEQVRQPIYSSALEQWRHYEPWLTSLKQTLGPLGSEYNSQTMTDE